jgi:nucleoside permease NupC
MPHPTTLIKVMALVIGVLSGVIGALTAFTVSQHLGATDLESFSSIGVSFLGTTMFVCFVEEKLGLL